MRSRDRAASISQRTIEGPARQRGFLFSSQPIMGPQSEKSKSIVARNRVGEKHKPLAARENYFEPATNPAATHPIARTAPHGMKNPSNGRTAIVTYDHRPGAGVGYRVWPSWVSSDSTL